MSVDFLPPERDKQPDYGAWPPYPRVTPVLIALWSLLLTCPISVLATGAVWFWEGWQQGLRALVASAVVLCLMFLQMLYLAEKERRAMDRRKPSRLRKKA